VNKKYYIEINPLVDISTIEETLTRLGIRSNRNLYQSCNYVNVKDKHYIIHYKELFTYFSFVNSGKIEEGKVHLTDDDLIRRNNIINKLKEWKFIDIINNENYINNNISIRHGNFFVIPHKDKYMYKLVQKVTL
jgi:hypothetical protein